MKEITKSDKKQKKKYGIRRIFSTLVMLLGTKTKKSFSEVISRIISEYEASGIISPEEKKMIKNISSLGPKKAYDIMVPRADIVAMHQGISLEDIKKIIVTQKHTRVPIFRENLDDIIGFVHIKDLINILGHEEDFNIENFIRKILFVPGSVKIVDLLVKMRISRVHMAIVLDEFGGVDGLITIENIIEEIVGNIDDEHDLPTESSHFKIKKNSDNSVTAGGRVLISKIEEVLETKIKKSSDQFETVSGLAIKFFSRVPEAGEEIEKNGLRIKVIDSDNQIIKSIQIDKIKDEDNKKSKNPK